MFLSLIPRAAVGPGFMPRLRHKTGRNLYRFHRYILASYDVSIIKGIRLDSVADGLKDARFA